MKNICLPAIENSQNKFILKYENTPVAMVYYNLIKIQGDNKIDNKISVFYDRLIEKYCLWVDNSFKQYVENSYLSDQNPKKKYRYKPYILTFDMLYEFINDRYLGVEIQVNLTQDNKSVARKQVNHLWDLSTGYLQIKKIKKKKKSTAV